MECPECNQETNSKLVIDNRVLYKRINKDCNVHILRSKLLEIKKK